MEKDKFVCDVCDWVYNPEVGDPEGGIEPGTPFADLPDDWVCPICGVGKDRFHRNHPNSADLISTKKSHEIIRAIFCSSKEASA